MKDEGVNSYRLFDSVVGVSAIRATAGFEAESLARLSEHLRCNTIFSFFNSLVALLRNEGSSH